MINKIANVNNENRSVIPVKKKVKVKSKINNNAIDVINYKNKFQGYGKLRRSTLSISSQVSTLLCRISVIFIL
jgi:hypothetical protein